MFDFSENSLNSNLTNDNNDYLLYFNDNSFSEIFLNKKDQDFTLFYFREINYLKKKFILKILI